METLKLGGYTAHLFNTYGAWAANFPKLATEVCSPLTWGFNVPENGWAFSARAILSRDKYTRIILVSDRTDTRNITDSGALIANDAFEKLQEAVKKWYIDPAGEEFVMVQNPQARVVALATPNKSYGYLYLSVFEYSEEV